MTTRSPSLLLVDPGSSRSELNEPIGIDAVAAAAAATTGATVHQSFAPLSRLPVPADYENADILGLSMPLGSLAASRAFVQGWRSLPAQLRPLLVLGGLLPTFATDAVLDEFPEAILVVGEGEDAIGGLVAAVANGPGAGVRGRLEQGSVPNLVFRAGDQVVRTPRRLVELADALPPTRAWTGQVATQGGIVRAEASRGCSWGRCTFCAIQHKYCDQARWRDFPVARVLEQLEHLSAAGVRHPYFTDEDFVGDDPVRTILLARGITEAKARGQIARELTLYVDMRVDSILAAGSARGPSGADVLVALRAAGLREVFVGIESGSREQVRRYKKPATAARNLRALSLLRELGIEVDVGFIFFDPEMSLDEAAANLDFLREAGLWSHDARLTKEVRVQAGTPLVDQYRDRGFLVGPLDVDDLTFPYRWVDPRVEAVHAAFRAWESIDRAGVYLLQAATRGEVLVARQRRARRDLLGRIRAVEHEALEALVRAAQSGRDPGAVELGWFTERRRALLASWASVEERAA